MTNKFISSLLFTCIATLAMDLNEPLITSSGSVVVGEAKMALDSLTLKELETLKNTLSQSSQSKNPKIVKSLTQIQYLINQKKHLALLEQQSREIERVRLKPQLEIADRIATCVNAMRDKKESPNESSEEEIRKRSKSEPTRPKLKIPPLNTIEKQKIEKPQKRTDFFWIKKKKT